MASRHISASFLAIAGSLTAQVVTVSPVAYSSTEGPASLSIPFSSPQIRYQQVHGDLRGDPKLLTAISLRRDGLWTGTTGVSRLLDMDLCVGHASFATVTNNFTSNYLGAPTLVIARRVISTPDWATAPLHPPAPFDLTFAFDSPASYSGASDLLWELKVYSNSPTPGYDTVADFAAPDAMDALSMPIGTSCLSSGQTDGYLLLGTIAALASGEYRFGAQGLHAPANSAFNYLLFGVSDPNLDSPWLCSPLHSSGEVTLMMPMADSLGTWTQPSLFFPANPYFVGFELYWQAGSIDYGQPGLPLTMTAGRKLTLQAVPYGALVLSKHLYELADLSTPVAGHFAEGGFVTQFVY
jgi:hypothetical protein